MFTEKKKQALLLGLTIILVALGLFTILPGSREIRYEIVQQMSTPDIEASRTGEIVGKIGYEIAKIYAPLRKVVMTVTSGLEIISRSGQAAVFGPTRGPALAAGLEIISGNDRTAIFGTTTEPALLAGLNVRRLGTQVAL